MALASGSSKDSETKKIVEATSAGEVTKDDTTKKTTGTTDETTTAEVKNTAATIEQQVLLEKDGLKITAVEMVYDSFWGDGVKLLIENNSDKNLGVSCNALIVNNYMFTNILASDVAAGKKANDTMYVFSDDLKAAGIENIGQIEVYFHVYDSKSYDTVFDSECITIKTSEFAKMDTKAADDGKELLNKDGIRIVGKYVDESSFWGTGVLLFIENTSGKNVSISCDDMSINGFMVTPSFSSKVYDGKMALSAATIYSSDLEDNGITSVDNIELTFHVYNADTYETIFDSDVISFATK
jgi:hypothetical protein